MEVDGVMPASQLVRVRLTKEGAMHFEAFAVSEEERLGIRGLAALYRARHRPDDEGFSFFEEQFLDKIFSGFPVEAELPYERLYYL
jgi:hypothetical protein